MKNIETIKDDLAVDFKNMANAETDEAFAEAQMNVLNKVSDQILKEAQNAQFENLNDANVLNARGLDRLTAEETAYYNEVIGNKGFVGTEQLLPATVVDRIFRDINDSHEILSKISMMNTTGQTTWLSRKDDFEGAYWGELNSEIVKELSAGFVRMNTELYKLSAFVPVSNDMLALGPVWIDRYIRIMLSEAIAHGLEKAIIDGNGINCPTGMIKDPTKPKDPEEGYPNRTPKSAIYLDPRFAGYTGAMNSDGVTPKEAGIYLIMKELSEDRKTAVGTVTCIVNQKTYWSKVFPAMRYFANGVGQFTDPRMFPINFVTSIYVDDDVMIACIPEDYTLTVGLKGAIESSAEFRWLEDQTVYKQKMLANGLQVRPESFKVYNIATGTPDGTPEI